MQGADPYPAVTTISVNDELVHGIPGKRKLKKGDIVSIDCGSIVDGFVADSALTVGVGEISEEAQKLIDVTLEALYIGIAQMVEDNRTGDISAAIQEYVERNGFNVVREYTSHGVGRSMHEDPQVPNFCGKQPRGRGDFRLEPGLVIAVEPMVNMGKKQVRTQPDRWTQVTADGLHSAHFEHTIAITESGPYVLTASPEQQQNQPTPDTNEQAARHTVADPESIGNLGVSGKIDRGAPAPEI